MKVLVTGVKGQLGFDVVNELEKRGHTAIGVDVDTMDITNPEQVESVIKANMPEAVIHCAAYTAVDLAEDNKELCNKINGEGTENSGYPAVCCTWSVYCSGMPPAEKSGV